jgi:hypothetical protein
MPVLGIVASQISGHLFAPSGAYDSIATVTVGTAQSTITFSSIPATYTHLQVRYISNNTVNAYYINCRFNGDSGSNYAAHELSGSGTAASASGAASQTSFQFPRSSSGASSALIFAGGVVDILDYANTNKYKTTRGLGGYDANGSGAVDFESGLWMNTAAITSIVLSSATGNFAQYSSFALYGIRGN